MPGNEDLKRRIPEIPSVTPVTLLEYSISPSKNDPDVNVGNFTLDVNREMLAGWVTDLSACLRAHRRSREFTSDAPYANLFTNTFVLRKVGEDGVKVQLRGLKGLQTPVTLFLKPDVATIRFPLNFKETAEDPKVVVEQLGPAFWSEVPSRVKEYHDKRVSKPDYSGKSHHSKKEKLAPAFDPVITERLTEILVNRFDGSAEPDQLRKAYERTYRERLPEAASSLLEKITGNAN
ncbi:MAG TPA: hypothetical protein VM077_02770 [Candidatus Limnocylindrales bacterium]|nr:hypothetical protein [Candidatus Limnocylindrales bacterium]